MIEVFSLLLAALLGYAAHRASLCSVLAVAEIINNRRAYMLLSFVKTAAWAMLVTLVIVWLFPGQGMIEQAYAFTITGLAGGFLFGLGATLNGGCAFSTLSHLADGEMWMLASLGGICTGIIGVYLAADNMAIESPIALPVEMMQLGTWHAIVLVVLGIWGTRELWKLWRSRHGDFAWHQRIAADRYRLSTAALVLGVSSGFLYSLNGPWTYTATLKREMESLFNPAVKPSVFLFALFAAIVAGMFISSWQRGSFNLRWRGGWMRRFVGGLFMGMGGAAIPGGNDTLILRAIPVFSPHAVPAFISLLFGIAFALLGLRLLTGKSINVDCSGDTCRIGEK